MIFKNDKGKDIKIVRANRYTINWDSNCRSKVQKRVKDLLKQYWECDMVYEEFPVAGSRLTLDFYNASCNIAIEVDGLQHYKYNKHFHKDSRNNFLNQLKRDDFKERFCEINKIILHRIREDENLEEKLKEFNL
jgi:hypothetical protein